MADLNQGVTPIPPNPTGYMPPSAPAQPQQPPWAGLNNPQVAQQPQAQQPQAQQPQAQQPQAQQPQAQQPPWAGLNNPQVMAAPPPSAGQDHAGYVAQKAEAALTAMDQQPQPTTFLGRVGSVVRGLASDTLDALNPIKSAQGIATATSNLAANDLGRGVVTHFAEDATLGGASYAAAHLTNLLHPDVPVADAYARIQNDLAATGKEYPITTGAAGLGGMVALGGAEVKGALALGRAALPAATRAGLVDGAMAWAARNPFLSKVVGTVAAGAGLGGAQSAVQASIAHAVNEDTGGYNPQTIAGATLNGALVGAIMAPVAGVALKQAGGVAQYIGDTLKGWFGGDTTQAALALKKFTEVGATVYGGTVDDFLANFRQGVADHLATTGRVPAAAEVIGYNAAKEIGSLASGHVGMAGYATDLAENQIGPAIASVARKVDNGPVPLQDVEQIRNQIQGVFGGLMKAHGDVPVTIPAETVAALRASPKLLSYAAESGNAAAQQIKGVVDAQDAVNTLNQRVASLSGKLSAQNARQALAGVQTDVQALLNGASANNPNAFKAAQALVDKGMNDPNPLSMANTLSKFIRLQGAIDRRINATVGMAQTTQALTEARTLLSDAISTTNAYAQNGLKTTLRAANDLRIYTSGKANSADDLLKDSAKSVRDAVANIGVKEVPRYRMAVRLWNSGNVRMDAATLGKQGVTAAQTPENVQAMLQNGRLPQGSNANPAVVQRGANVGGRVAIRDALRQTTGEAASTINNLAGNPSVQQNLRALAPAQAEGAITAAQQVQKGLGGLRGMVTNSKGALAEEAGKMKDFFEGLTFQTLGGAGRSGVMTRWLMARQIPRTQAKYILDHLGDPGKVEAITGYMMKKGVDPAAFRAVAASAMAQIGGTTVK